MCDKVNALDDILIAFLSVKLLNVCSFLANILYFKYTYICCAIICIYPI